MRSLRESIYINKWLICIILLLYFVFILFVILASATQFLISWRCCNIASTCNESTQQTGFSCSLQWYYCSQWKIYKWLYRLVQWTDAPESWKGMPDFLSPTDLTVFSHYSHLLTFENKLSSIPKTEHCFIHYFPSVHHSFLFPLLDLFFSSFIPIRTQKLEHRKLIL